MVDSSADSSTDLRDQSETVAIDTVSPTTNPLLRASVFFNIINKSSKYGLDRNISGIALILPYRFLQDGLITEFSVTDKFFNTRRFIELVREFFIPLVQEQFKGIGERIRSMMPGMSEVEEGQCIMELIKGEGMDVAFYNTDLKLVDFIRDHIMSLLFVLFKKIAGSFSDTYDAFCCIYGDSKSRDDFDKLWKENCEWKSSSITNKDRGIVSDTVSLHEVFLKVREWTAAIAQSQAGIIEVDMGNNEIIHICRFFDPGLFHYKLSRTFFDFGRVEGEIAPGAIGIHDFMLFKASESGFFDENSEVYTRLVPLMEELDEKFRRMNYSDKKTKEAEESKEFFKMSFSDSLKKLVSDFAEKFLAAIDKELDDSDPLSRLVMNIIERAVLGYHAWLHKDGDFIEKVVMTDQISSIVTKKTKDQIREIPHKVVFEKTHAQVRRAIYNNGRLVPVAIPKESYIDFPLFLNLPFVYPKIIKVEDKKERIWVLSDIRVPTTGLVCDTSKTSYDVKVEDATPKSGIYVWIYSKDDEARKYLEEKKGEIEIDGKRFFLLIYNPNADFKYTGWSHIRGCWFILAKDKDGVFKVTDKDAQKFVIVTTNGQYTLTQEFDLSGLTCETE